MKKLLLLLLCLTLLPGCSIFVAGNSTIQPPIVTYIPEPTPTSSGMGDLSPLSVGPSTAPSEPSGFGISPGKITTTGYYSGGVTSYTLSIRNHDRTPKTYMLTFVDPGSSVTQGYSPFMVSDNWVKVENKYPMAMPGETTSVLLTLKVPAGVDLPLKWEFWINVKEAQGAGVQTAYNCRWLVDMEK